MKVKLEDNNKVIHLVSEDTTDVIEPVSLKHFNSISSSQKLLLERLFELSGQVQKLLQDKKSLSLIEKINKLLKDKNGIEINIEEFDIDDFIKMYFTSNDNRDEHGYIEIFDNGKINLKPSYIGVIHGIDFFTILKEIVEKMQKENEKETTLT